MRSRITIEVKECAVSVSHSLPACLVLLSPARARFVSACFTSGGDQGESTGWLSQIPGSDPLCLSLSMRPPTQHQTIPKSWHRSFPVSLPCRLSLLEPAAPARSLATKRARCRKGTDWGRPSGLLPQSGLAPLIYFFPHDPGLASGRGKRGTSPPLAALQKGMAWHGNQRLSPDRASSTSAEPFWRKHGRETRRGLPAGARGHIRLSERVWLTTGQTEQTEQTEPNSKREGD